MESEIAVQWYLKVLRNYATFTGRARPREFWLFLLVHLIIQFVLDRIDVLLGLVDSGGLGPFGTVYALAVLVPWLAVGARRLHDTGRSGWWQLIGLIPLVGAIVLIVFWAQAGHRGPNAHGADPKGVDQHPISAA